jgi:hydrogenase large subunit
MTTAGVAAHGAASLIQKKKRDEAEEKAEARQGEQVTSNEACNVVDPVTRIEGHLRVEVQVDEASGKVQDALSSGTAWRGLELIMKDRDPRDAWAYIQRICGVCTTAHALASLRAVEDALGIKIPKNANYIRNIMAAAQTVQDHAMHFYHLHALDWVSPVEALAADPVATAHIQT